MTRLPVSDRDLGLTRRLVQAFASPPSFTMAQSQIPLALPSLPHAIDVPWSAEIVEAHNGLTSTFRTSRAALNLDESDPIRLGHHLKQAETFMVSIVEVLGHQTLPHEYIEAISGAVSSLVLGLRQALTEATAAFVISLANLLGSSTDASYVSQ